jgi:hypothetical protein
MYALIAPKCCSDLIPSFCSLPWEAATKRSRERPAVGRSLPFARLSRHPPDLRERALDAKTCVSRASTSSVRSSRHFASYARDARAETQKREVSGIVDRV